VATFLPRTVVVLGLVSLLNDAASEMVTPLLPLFLTAALGAGPAIVGLVEGVAEATASVLKVLSGRLADRGFGSRRLVLGGYSISTLVRPVIAFAGGWPVVLVLRFLDRIGKGLRTAPRDAMISAAVPVAARGRAFGFHRAMDHAGAVFGPLAAFALLSAGAGMEQIFLASVVPGLLVIGLVFLGLPADPPLAPVQAPRLSWRALDPGLRRLMLAAGLLSLAAVPEVFIVLWATTAGLPVAAVPLAWALASLAKMLIAIPAGAWSDRIGRRPVLLAGWTLRVCLLLLLAWMPASGAAVWVLFASYAMALAATEAAERSLVGDLAPQALRGTAFGLYHLVTGLAALPGALLFGVLWQAAGPSTAFCSAAGVTAAAALLMLRLAGGARPRTAA
jgi:MFS family permease